MACARTCAHRPSYASPPLPLPLTRFRPHRWSCDQFRACVAVQSEEEARKHLSGMLKEASRRLARLSAECLLPRPALTPRLRAVDVHWATPEEADEGEGAGSLALASNPQGLLPPFVYASPSPGEEAGAEAICAFGPEFALRTNSLTVVLSASDLPSENRRSVEAELAELLDGEGGEEEEQEEEQEEGGEEEEAAGGEDGAGGGATAGGEAGEKGEGTSEARLAREGEGAQAAGEGTGGEEGQEGEEEDEEEEDGEEEQPAGVFIIHNGFGNEELTSHARTCVRVWDADVAAVFQHFVANRSASPFTPRRMASAPGMGVEEGAVLAALRVLRLLGVVAAAE